MSGIWSGGKRWSTHSLSLQVVVVSKFVFLLESILFYIFLKIIDFFTFSSLSISLFIYSFVIFKNCLSVVRAFKFF